MSSVETVVFYLSGLGTLAMVIGAFGLLDAFNGHNKGERRVLWLLALYTGGIVSIVAGLTVYGRWYFAVLIALMLVPVEIALRKHGFYGERARVENR
jgi:hypothetical protein